MVRAGDRGAAPYQTNPTHNCWDMHFAVRGCHSSLWQTVTALERPQRDHSQLEGATVCCHCWPQSPGPLVVCLTALYTATLHHCKEMPLVAVHHHISLWLVVTPLKRPLHGQRPPQFVVANKHSSQGAM